MQMFQAWWLQPGGPGLSQPPRRRLYTPPLESRSPESRWRLALKSRWCVELPVHMEKWLKPSAHLLNNHLIFMMKQSSIEKCGTAA